MITKISISSEIIALQRFTLIIALLICSATVLFAQNPAPTPTPQDDVVKITTTLIQVDATVTDRKGKIVSDLRKDDFEIYENGKKQKITTFSFVSNVRSTTSPEEKKIEIKDAGPVPPTKLRTEQVRRTIALVVDDLALSFESSHFVRRALKKFVDEQMQEGDLVAILRTGSSVGALQQFTTDKRQLYASIDRVRWNPGGSAGFSAFEPIEAKGASPAAGSSESEGGGERTPEGQAREMEALRQSTFTFGTLAVIDHIIKGMQELPGRKSIMLMSEGFALHTKDAGGWTEESKFLQKLRGLIDRASRSSVVVYTIDPRGLQYTGVTAADNTSGRTPIEIQQEVSERANKLFDSQDGLRFLARETGGFAFLNNNDISAGIRKVLDDQSYYLIGYEPDDDSFDPKTRKFNKLDIKVNRPSTDIRFRSGFFGQPGEAAVAKASQTRDQRLLSAITSPFGANEIPLHLNALFGNTPNDGSFIRSLMHIDVQNLTFIEGPDGSKRAAFDVVAVCFGDNGVPVEQINGSRSVRVPKDRFAEVLREGLLYDFTFKIPKPGAYQLRIAISDQENQKTGSASQFIEIPNLKKKRLTISGMLVQSISLDQWNKQAGEGAAPADQTLPNPLGDTSLRKFKRGTVLDYGVTVYNAKLDPAGLPSLNLKVRVFKDGKLFFDGAPKPVPPSAQTDMQRVRLMGSLALEKQLMPGDYVLQLVVTDDLIKGKNNTVTQYTQFEVIE